MGNKYTNIYLNTLLNYISSHFLSFIYNKTFLYDFFYNKYGILKYTYVYICTLIRHIDYYISTKDFNEIEKT